MNKGPTLTYIELTAPSEAPLESYVICLSHATFVGGTEVNEGNGRDTDSSAILAQNVDALILVPKIAIQHSHR